MVHPFTGNLALLKNSDLLISLVSRVISDRIELTYIFNFMLAIFTNNVPVLKKCLVAKKD